MDATLSRHTFGEAVDMVDAPTPDRAVGLLHCRMDCGLASGLGNNWNLSRDWSDFRGGGSDNGISCRDHSRCTAHLWECSEVAMVFLGIPCSLRFSCSLPDSAWSTPIIARFFLRCNRGCAVGCISYRPGSIRAVGDEKDVVDCVSAHDALTQPLRSAWFMGLILALEGAELYIAANGIASITDKLFGF